MIEDWRKMGENSLINDKLKKIVLALLVSFFFYYYFFLEKNYCYSDFNFLLYCI